MLNDIGFLMAGIYNPVLTYYSYFLVSTMKYWTFNMMSYDLFLSTSYFYISLVVAVLAVS